MFPPRPERAQLSRVRSARLLHPRVHGRVDQQQRAQLMKLNQEKKSVLDAVLADGNEIAAQLGAADKARLASHLDAIRQIEMQLAAMPTMSPTITIPDDPQKAGVSMDMKSEAPQTVNKVM
ncbi:MAG: DUF1552 domain-containing protein, partial [Pseudomonadota bacterium]